MLVIKVLVPKEQEFFVLVYVFVLCFWWISFVYLFSVFLIDLKVLKFEENDVDFFLGAMGEESLTNNKREDEKQLITSASDEQCNKEIIGLVFKDWDPCTKPCTGLNSLIQRRFFFYFFFLIWIVNFFTCEIVITVTLLSPLNWDNFEPTWNKNDKFVQHALALSLRSL